MKKKALLLMLFMMFISTSALSQNTIYGTVTGDVQEDVTITLNSVSPSATETTTGSDGTYSFSELANGDYTVTPSLAGYSFTPANTPVTISGSDVTGIDFTSVADVIDDDIDDDGVLNEDDECESTPAGVIIDLNGCSIEQLVPCNGNWKNHGQYESAFTQTVNSFIKQKLIAKEEKGALMKEVASSDCGKDDFTAKRIIYTDAGVLDNQIIEQAQIMTTHIEDTGIEVRATEVNWLEFGGSYAGINAEENWVQPYFSFSPEDMSAYTNAPSEINGIINTKMKSKDGIEDKFGIILDGEQGTCADVQEEIYAATFLLLNSREKAKYLAEGKSLSFIQDDRPGNTPDSNPVLQSAGWLPVDPATKITRVGDDYFYEPLGLYISFDEPLAGDDERYKGIRYCKLLSHQAILSWFLSKSFEDDPVLITPSAFECTDPRLRSEFTNGSCLFWFSQGNHYYCSDYIGYDFTPESAVTKCISRGAEAVYSSDTCSKRDVNGEIEAYMTNAVYAGHGALCDVHCMEGNEFLWNLYEPNVGEADCGNFPIFYP